MEDAHAQLPAIPLPSNCPTPREYVKRMQDISTNIAAVPGDFPTECGLGDEQFTPRNWPSMMVAWKASALCHQAAVL